MVANGTHIVDHLCEITDLRLPGQMTRDGNLPTASKKREYLIKLLEHDPGVFLERYGDVLNAEELQHFEKFRNGSYEVDFYLRMYTWDHAQPSVQTQSPGKLSAVAKNRRLAHMQRLITEGEYFSDEAMRERAPYLHHIYVGKYGPCLDDSEAQDEPASEIEQPACGSIQGRGQDEGPEGKALPPPLATGAARRAATGAAADAPTTLAGSIMHWQRQIDISHRRHLEEERYDMIEESESESGDEDEDPGQDRARQQAQQEGSEGSVDDGGHQEFVGISDDLRMEYSATLLDIMQQRFLSGQDPDIDYRAIDADASLDDDFADQANCDAEEKYFDAD